jgi:adhesin transport system outer membrane protein
LVLLETSRYAEGFAAYRILASTGALVPTLRLPLPPAAEPYARGQARVPPTPPAETMRQFSPDRGPHPWVTTIIGPNPWVTTVK